MRVQGTDFTQIDTQCSAFLESSLPLYSKCLLKYESSSSEEFYLQDFILRKEPEISSKSVMFKAGFLRVGCNSKNF